MEMKTKNRVVNFEFRKMGYGLDKRNERQFDLIVEILKDKRIPYELNKGFFDSTIIQASLTLEDANEIANVIEATDVTFQVH